MVFAIIAGVFVLIPITAILTEHQRRMAKIRASTGGSDKERLDALERRIGQLADIVHEQTIALDSVLSHVRGPFERIQERVER